MQLLSKLLVVIGVLIITIASYTYWQRNNPNRLKFNAAAEYVVVEKNTQVQDSDPIGLVIQDLGIRLPIIEANYFEDRWETTSEGVSYLNSTVQPGEIGNSVLYGHNWGSILKNLPKAKPGQTIQIIYADGSTKDFEITYTQEVTPNDTSILKNTKDTRITLYTCSGFLDSKRFVVTALLK